MNSCWEKNWCVQGWHDSEQIRTSWSHIRFVIFCCGGHEGTSLRRPLDRSCCSLWKVSSFCTFSSATAFAARPCPSSFQLMTEHHGAPECYHSGLIQGSLIRNLGTALSAAWVRLSRSCTAAWGFSLHEPPRFPFSFHRCQTWLRRLCLPMSAFYLHGHLTQEILESTFLAFVSQRTWDFPGGSDGKESACNAGDLGLVPGLGRSPGEEKGHPLQYYGLENSMDRGTWWARVQGVAKS